MTQIRFTPLNYVIYQDISHRHVKIHADFCKEYKTRDSDQTFREDGRKSGQWYGSYRSIEEAENKGMQLEERVLTCMHCIKRDKEAGGR